MGPPNGHRLCGELSTSYMSPGCAPGACGQWRSLPGRRYPPPRVASCVQARRTIAAHPCGQHLLGTHSFFSVGPPHLLRCYLLYVGTSHLHVGVCTALDRGGCVGRGAALRRLWLTRLAWVCCAHVGKVRWRYCHRYCNYTVVRQGDARRASAPPGRSRYSCIRPIRLLCMSIDFN